MPDHYPGLIVGGMRSSDGKTAVTSLLLAALRAREVPVQPFKAGPDFIDPGYHTRISGIPSRNLDAWLMGDRGIVDEVAANSGNRLSILEGVMGLFDGSDTRSEEGSTMALARLLDWPVILVLAADKSGRSLAVALRGFIQEAGPGRIRGVILNGVRGGAHADYLREAIEPLAIPVLGALPFCPELRWEERHLGLQASQEHQLPGYKELAVLAEKHLDIKSIFELSNTGATRPRENPPGSDGDDVRVGKLRIGIARDEAFHFYYQANLDYLTNAGAELVEFSPLHDAALPAGIDAVFLGGGFPEVFAPQLSENSAMRTDIRSAIRSGLNCYAECGGLMLLAEELVTLDQKTYPMTGVVPGSVRMTESLKHFGYCACSDPEKFPGAVLPGHEFHHSLWTGEPEHANLWTARRKRSGAFRREGFSAPNLHASYVHLYFRTGSAAIQLLLNRERSP